MSSPYIGEIRMFGGNFAPAGWAFCDGQLLSISENDALFTLIGTTYGGDGQENFALPNLQGRASMGVGNGMILGENGGVETVTLTTQQIPVHNHTMLCSSAQATVNQVNQNFAASLLAAGDNSAYAITKPYKAINPNAIGPVGGSQPHDNLQPYLVISFIISLFGVFPPPN